MKGNPLLVERMVAAATDAMNDLASEASSAEVLSACFTLTLRVLQATIELETLTPEQVQQAIGVLYLAAIDPKGRPN